jgi:hypothetical protein
VIRRFLMVTFIRSASINGIENQQKAMEWAKQITKYVDGKFGYSDVQVGVQIYGHTGRIHWIGKQESLESLGRGVQQSLTDPGYQAELLKGAGLFVPASIRDTVVVGI